MALACVCAFGQYQPDYPQGPQPYQPQNAASYQQDPNDVPGQNVARLSWMAGDVSIRRGDSGQPVAAAINAPVMVEDYVTTAPGAQAELQLDYAQRARLGPDAEMRLAALEGDHYQLQLSRGFLNFSVLREPPAQVEISTQSVSVRPVGLGSFRVWVREDGETTITVRSGEVEIATPQGTQQLHRGQSMLVRGDPQDPQFQMIGTAGPDEFDIWCDRRDREMERSASYRYVSQDIVGAEDLDSYGRWDNDPQYGEVWVPQVSADWAPYQDGRWSWEDYYGWTWVGAEPWGWAPYHYGNWYRASFGWAWYPGRYREHHFWRPAVVGFFGFGGDGGFGFGFSNVGWCPLAPFEPYHPWYGRGGRYGGYGNTGFAGINIVNNTNVTNIYRNARYGATAVNAQQFVNGGARYARVGSAQLQNASLVRGQLPLTPTVNNLRFSNRQTNAIPRTNFQNSRFYSRSPQMPQSAVRMPFQQQQQLVQQSQQAFTRHMAAPGVRYGSQIAGGQNAQPLARRSSEAGYSGANNLNQRGPQPLPNNQPYVRPGYGQPQGNWSRFGQPNGAGNTASPRAANPGTGWSAYSNRGVPFGNNPQNPTRPQYSSPGYSYGQQRSLQLSQPVVQPRPAAPAYSAPAYRQPAYSAPAYRAAPARPQTYSAPAYRQPAYSAPAYRAAPARPQAYSAPAYRQPAYSAPAYRAAPARPQAYSAPAYRQPAYSAPAYRQQPTSRPSYSPPAYSRPQQYSAPQPRAQPSYHAAPAARPSSGGQDHKQR